MIDYLVYFKELETDGIKAIAETVVTLEQNFNNTEMLEEALIEQLKVELDIECDVELISYESLINSDVDVENI